MIVEQSFPRGGIPAKENKAEIRKKDNIIFGALQTKLKKPKRNKDTLAPEELFEREQNDTIEAHSAELLNYETIQDGMNIMGMINSVEQLSITVSLPGRMMARISALDISESYTKAAREYLENTENAKSYKTLQDLYKVGQLVYGRVQEVKKHENSSRTEISMTLKPGEVHADLVHSNIRKGFIFNGAISEIQEHGYIIESGINGLRAFLPSDMSQEGLALGQLVFLRVEKITIDVSTSTCSCKQMKMDQLRVKSIQSEPNIDYILPTTIVNFEVTKCLKNGLQGTIMNEAFTAYVNEHQLSEPLMLPEDYDIKSKHNARILYVMPLTKFVYLSLNLQKRPTKTERDDDDDDDGEKRQTLKRGDVIEDARVHHIGTGGVVLILNNKMKGLISYKTMRANYKGNYDQDELLNKYSKKSKHRVRILDYNLMDTMYICTDDKAVVDENYFILDDLKPGDFVNSVVTSFNPKIAGYNVEIGKLKGQIEELYLMSGIKQLEPNTKLRCRVISLNRERNMVSLTNRPEYMSKSCKLLLSFDTANINNDYMGTVVKTGEKYYTVRFCNNVIGMLYHSELNGKFHNERNITLNIGQTMLFRIGHKMDTKLILRMATQICPVGKVCDVKVTNVLHTGLEINVQIKNKEETDIVETKGIIPIHLLSDFSNLVMAKSKMFTLNSKLEAVSLYKNIFSVRDVKYFKEIGIKSWKKIAIGDVLRAFIENINDDVVEVYVPILGYKKLVKIHSRMLLLSAFYKPNIKLEPEQTIYVKITGKDEATKTISVTAKLNAVWDRNLSSTASYVESYLSEIAQIREALKEKQMPISQIGIGDKITVIFKGIDSETRHWRYQTEKSNIFAIAKESIMTGGKMKVPVSGAKQEAIVLWIDYSKNLIYISTKTADIKHITNSTVLPAELSNAKQVNAKVLLKLEHVFICSLKKAQNPLVFCPIMLHYNDFEQTASTSVKEGEFCKLAFIHNSNPIAVLQDTWSVWHNDGNKKRKNSLQSEQQVPEKLKKNPFESKDEQEQSNTAEEKYAAGVKKKNSNAEYNKPKEKTKNSASDSIKTTGTETEITTKGKKKKKKALSSDEISAPLKKKVKTSESSKGLESVITETEADRKDLSNSALFIVDTSPKLPHSSAKTIGPLKKQANSESSKGLESTKSKSETDTNYMSGGGGGLLFYEDTTPYVPQSKPIGLKTLAGVSDFWTTDLSKLNDSNTDESSDDNDEEEQNTNDASKQKKKRLNAVEKFKQQREEEERLREIEAKYADPNQLPETVDQFDRLVISDPNNSKNWINYMVFHLQSAEIDKARAVARRAIKAISMRNSDDLLNIWVALLNLEIRYGARESFDTTLKEALTFNEPIKVYLRVVEILREANKQQELIEIIGIITKKFKGDQSAWKTAADALFSIGQTDKAQQMLHKSLASLPEREHVNTIVIFANLNHKHGCNEMAHTLLDQIVTSYPKRVDVWAQYVDMLVKDQLIDSARSVLERAILQKIPMKKMRTVFKKFLEFEERHGTEADVEKVKRLATEYVKQNAHIDD